LKHPTNTSGVSFTNTASYTYDKINGDSSSQGTGAAGTANMSVIEPHLTATKSVSYASPSGQAITVPAKVGDVLQYTITIPNNGNSEAFDADVIDTLPANVSMVPGSAMALINGTPAPGFIANPATSATVPTLPSGTLAWGSQYNGDGSLDIPVSQSLVLTYQVTVQSANGAPITNTAWAAWTSRNGALTGERTGAGCRPMSSPNIMLPPASATPVPGRYHHHYQIGGLRFLEYWTQHRHRLDSARR
jgi:uncharacterized repeat protein (TIGR01451 family)